MIRSFRQTKEYLYSLIPTTKGKRFPGELGLARMKYLLACLGNPQEKFASVHIVGTSGKSSTAYLIAKIIQSAGYKVGLHISPHLQTMRERLQVNGRLIREKEFIKLLNLIKPVAEKMAETRYGSPSYFEMLLAAAFLYFSKEKVDLSVIEAGLGGRFDGTNVLQPEIVVLTNIGLDHTEILGKTKTTILKNKMQTIKSSTRLVISGIKEKHLLRILQSHCALKKIPLLVYNQDFFISNSSSFPNYSQFTFNRSMSAFEHTPPPIPPPQWGGGIKNGKSPLPLGGGRGGWESYALDNIKLNLPGIFQTENAALAIAACLGLAESKKFSLRNEQIRKGLAKAYFPGRMETISAKPPIILDGGHNEDKIKALVKSMKKIYPENEIIVVFGVKKDKEVKKMLGWLNTISQQFIITQFGGATDLGFKLCYPVKKLYLKAKKLLPKARLFLEPNSRQALKKAQNLVHKTNEINEINEKKLILVTGSLYLIGEVRKYFKLKPNQPKP